MTFAQIVDTKIVPGVDAVVVPLLYALAFLFFLYGISKFFFSASDTQRAEGRKFAIYAIIALAVMFSVWGLVRVLLDSFFS